MTTERNDLEQTSLTPAALHILLALAAGDLHGYGLMQEIASYTQGAMQLGPGTLYRAIKQLLATGLISEVDQRPDPAHDDERRRYYRLTPRGKACINTELRRLEQLVLLGRARGVLPDEGAA